MTKFVRWFLLRMGGLCFAYGANNFWHTNINGVFFHYFVKAIRNKNERNNRHGTKYITRWDMRYFFFFSRLSNSIHKNLSFHLNTIWFALIVILCRVFYSLLCCDVVFLVLFHEQGNQGKFHSGDASNSYNMGVLDSSLLTFSVRLGCLSLLGYPNGFLNPVLCRTI